MGALKSSKCARGHKWTEESTGFRKGGPQAGQRYCRICKALYAQEAQKRKKAKNRE